MAEDAQVPSPLAASDAGARADATRALDRIVADSLPFVALVLGLLLAFFAIVDPFIYPAEHATQVALVDAAAAVGFLSVWAVTRRLGIRAGAADAVTFTLAMIVAADVVHDLLLLGDPTQTLYLVLLVTGAGSIFLSTRWLLAVFGLTMAGFLAVTTLRPGEWTTFGFALFAGTVLGYVIHHVRVRTYRRLEVLRLAAERAGAERDARQRALEAAVKAAQESEERYRRLVEQAPDAFLVHSEGRILYANEAAARLFGASSPEELVGRDVLSLPHESFRDVARARIEEMERVGRATTPMEMKAVRLDGSIVDVEAMGQPIQFLGRPANQTIIRDITDRKRVETERLLAQGRLAEIDRLKAMDRMKTQFVNTLSHELRTPLTPIKVQLHLLKSAAAKGDMERHGKATEMIERNFRRLSSLVDELLEVARLQAGSLRLDRAVVPLDETIAETMESFVDVAKQSRVDVAVAVPRDLLVDADAKRVSQVLYNLLGNALKFTPEGGSIRVEAAAEGDEAVVRVTDSGVGLREEDIARLFEPFSQVHDTMERTDAGTGLGLYICKSIVEGHGGRIWCDSAGPGKGSTFAFSLPLART